MKKIVPILFVIVITVAALFLRSYKIASIPPGLSWDEVSIGYNAYSILKTGKDEHGKFLPIDAFVAYGDYKPPLAIYLTVPFVALFGLDELAVRLPSALFGTLTVLLTYFLVQELFRRSKIDNREIQRTALLASALLAVSPWHINLSRAGFEANIALFFVVLGIYTIFVASRKPKIWTVAWLPFIAAIYTFNSARYFVPLFGLVLCGVFWKMIRENRKQFIIGALIASVAIAPILPHLVSKEARLRFTEVNIFTDSSVVVTANERIAYDGNSLLGKFLHNRRFGYALSYLRHFADNLQPSFLFVEGDGNPKFSTRVVGQLYIIEAPLLAIGMLSLFAIESRIAWILLIWLVLAIIPAATARETPHALRILNTLPTWYIFIAFGLTLIIQVSTDSIKKYKNLLRVIVIGIAVVLYSFCIGYYLHNYYAHYAMKYSGEWQYGYREGIQFAKTISNNYDTIYISSTIGRPYMYTLFYTQYDPNVFMKIQDAFFDSVGFYHVKGFGKYRFIDMMPNGGLQKKTLYIVDPGWVPSNARILKTITLLDGTERLVVFDKQ